MMQLWCKHDTTMMQTRYSHDTNTIQPWWKHDANMMQLWCKHVRNVFRTRFENGQKMVRTCSKHVWNMFWTCWQHVQKNIFFTIFVSNNGERKACLDAKKRVLGGTNQKWWGDESIRWPEITRKIRGEHTGELDCAKIISIKDAHFFNRVASRTWFPGYRNFTCFTIVGSVSRPGKNEWRIR